MAESNMGHWSDQEFARYYLEAADIIVPGRRTLLEILKSFYRYFLGHKSQNTVLDLGCGDGILVRTLLETDDSIAATLVDGSKEMLRKAREGLAGFVNMRFLRATFQELLDTGIQLPEFDLVVSSLAIHHLNNIERKALFEFVYSHVLEGGYFVNIDCVLAPAEEVEKWYLSFWEEGMVEKLGSLEVGIDHRDIMQKYLAEDHYSKIDTLANQMAALNEVGFRDVDCFYKRGIFAMYGGGKGR